VGSSEAEFPAKHKWYIAAAEKFLLHASYMFDFYQPIQTPLSRYM